MVIEGLKFEAGRRVFGNGFSALFFGVLFGFSTLYEFRDNAAIRGTHPGFRSRI